MLRLKFIRWYENLFPFIQYSVAIRIFFYKPDLTIYTYYLSRTHCYRKSQFFSPVFSLSLLYFAILVFMGFCRNKSFWLTWCTKKKNANQMRKKVKKATFYVRCSTDKHNRYGNFFFSFQARFCSHFNLVS